jgi:hypothetical protein
MLCVVEANMSEGLAVGFGCLHVWAHRVEIRGRLEPITVFTADDQTGKLDRSARRNSGDRAIMPDDRLLVGGKREDCVSDWNKRSMEGGTP